MCHYFIKKLTLLFFSAIQFFFLKQLPFSVKIPHQIIESQVFLAKRKKCFFFFFKELAHINTFIGWLSQKPLKNLFCYPDHPLKEWVGSWAMYAWLLHPASHHWHCYTGTHSKVLVTCWARQTHKNSHVAGMPPPLCLYGTQGKLAPNTLKFGFCNTKTHRLQHLQHPKEIK